MVKGRGLVWGTEGIATATTEHIPLGLKVMIDGNPVIKDKAVPLPQACGGGDVF